MMLMHYFSNLTYAIGGLLVFIGFLCLIVIASKGAAPKNKTDKDDRDDITCAGFSQMINHDD